MGCGRAGATLANNLIDRGHSVAIIDKNPDAFRRLPDDFPGQRVTGIGFDRDTLQQAGIEDAAGFAAVSSGDNSNIIAARVVRDTFGIDNVVTRIYDSSRAGVYERLGIATVATVRWTADRMLRKLINLGPHIEYINSTYNMTLFYVDIHPSWYGISCENLEQAVAARLAFIGRDDESILPDSDTVLQDGDNVYLIAAAERTKEIQRLLNHEIEEGWL